MSNTPDNNRPESGRSHPIAVETNVDSSVGEPIDTARISQAVRAAANHRGFGGGRIGVRLTDDDTIAQLNNNHLAHDYPTDVISFDYRAEHSSSLLDGEMVVSVETAQREARRIGWPAEYELLLYVVHGTLHVTGMDDLDAKGRAEMRDAETAVMTSLGIDDIARFGADVAVTIDRESEEVS